MMKKLTTVFTLLGIVSAPLMAQVEAGTSPVCEPVDLGLSVRWATCNVGAYAPEELGYHYAWGETSYKKDYTWSSYKYCLGSSTSMTKYCIGKTFGSDDQKSRLEAGDDAATFVWGDDWRIPTDAEWEELISKCECTWSNLNGVNGYWVKGKNGNSIFLPAAGDCVDTDLQDTNVCGYYRSSSLCVTHSFCAYDVCFDCDKIEVVDISRRFGLTIRPVTTKR